MRAFARIKALVGEKPLVLDREFSCLDLMEEMVALVLLAYAIGLLIGEEVRNVVYGAPLQEGEAVEEGERIPGQPQKRQGRKWKLYSGLFILLKQKLQLTAAHWRQMVKRVAARFAALVHHPVRSCV